MSLPESGELKFSTIREEFLYKGNTPVYIHVTDPTPAFNSGLQGIRVAGDYNNDITYFDGASVVAYDNNRTDFTNFSASSDNYSYRWLGYFKPNATGTWAFTLIDTDDHAHIWIGDEAVTDYSLLNAVANNYVYVSGAERTGIVSVTEGYYYPIRIYFGEGIGSDRIQLRISGPGQLTETGNASGYFFGSGQFGTLSTANALETKFSDYYRGGLYVNSDQTGIPTGGENKLSNFRGAFETASVSDIVAELSGNDSSYSVRNYLCSKSSVASGKETSTSRGDTQITSGLASTYRTATSVSGTLSFSESSSDSNGLRYGQRTKWVTIAAINVGQSVGNPSCSINGTAQTASQVYSNTLVSAAVVSGAPYVYNFSLFRKEIDFNDISSIQTTFPKVNDDSDNRQEVYVIPGKWRVNGSQFTTFSSSGSTATITQSVNQNDLIFAFMSRETNGYVSDGDYGTIGGSAREVLYMDRTTYRNSLASRLKVFIAANNGTISHTTGQESYDIDTAAYRPKHMIRLVYDS